MIEHHTHAALAFWDVSPVSLQKIEAMNVLSDAGAIVDKLVVVIDRQEGGQQKVEQAGFAFEALLTSADLGIVPNP